MFGSKKTQQSRGQAQATVIAGGTEVVGELRFSGYVEVLGLVQGNLVAAADAADASVQVLPGGKVEGDIVAPTVVVDSVVEGNIYAGKRVELAAGAEVRGDVHYQIIEMVQGSQVNGSLLYSPVESNAFSRGQASDAIDQGLVRAAGKSADKKDRAADGVSDEHPEEREGAEAKTAQDKQSALL